MHNIYFSHTRISWGTSPCNISRDIRSALLCNCPNSLILRENDLFDLWPPCFVRKSFFISFKLIFLDRSSKDLRYGGFSFLISPIFAEKKGSIAQARKCENFASYNNYINMQTCFLMKERCRYSFRGSCWRQIRCLDRSRNSLTPAKWSERSSQAKRKEKRNGGKGRAETLDVTKRGKN